MGIAEDAVMGSVMPYKTALAYLIKEQMGLDFLPDKLDITFDQGGDYQIGDMTWDHDNASLTIKFRHPEGTPGRRYEHYIDLEYYGLNPHPYGSAEAKAWDKENHPTGFGGLIQDLMRIAVEHAGDKP